MPEEDDLPRLLSGRYRLESTLGQGGMGVVYRGTDLLIKRSIAVKLIRGVDGLQLDDEIAGRFMREAKNTARLHHEHIIELFDLGRTDEGGLYFVMELLEGESLSARLRRERQLSPATTVHIVAQICSALQVAHASGVIHRDLKPANIMLVSRAGDDDFVKVLDFGVAKSLSGDQQTQLTHTGMLVGTIDYMAPEQIMGRPVDARTDIYALGIVLYRMLSGKPPFRDNGVPALVNAHLNTMPRPLVEMVSGVSNALDHVVLRCLAKAPEARFESMAELARALLATDASTPPSAEILDLSDSEHDVYQDGDRTVVAAFSPRSPNAAPVPDPVPSDDTTVGNTKESFDETTIRLGASIPNRQARASSPPPAVEGAIGHRASTLPPVRVPQARRGFPDAAGIPKRSVPEETMPLGRSEPGACAMCHTVNAPNVRSCVACGVSLSSEEQDALRERVATGSASAPPPGVSAAMSRPADPIHARDVPTSGASSTPWLPHHPSPSVEHPSMWERFLTWTGLRSR